MSWQIKPDETDAASKRVFFPIFTDDGKVTDHEAFVAGGNRLDWAADTFTPAASDLKIAADNGSLANYAGTFAYLANGEWYYEFANAEVAASLAAKTALVQFVKAGYRSERFRVDLRYDVESIKAAAIVAASLATDAIAAAAIKADAAAKIGGQVWEELVASHQASGSFGEQMARPTGAVVANGGNTALTFKTNITQADCKDAWLCFLSGALAGEVHKVTTFVVGTKFVTVANAFSGTPAGADRFILINK